MNTTSTPTPTPTPLSRNFTPSRFSERAFRDYEPFIARAVAAWPEETQFHPEEMVSLTGKPISPNTFVCRFRDAITALKTFSYETATIDTKKLWSITGAFTVAYGTAGTVWFRNKHLRGRPTGLTQKARELGYDVPKHPAEEPLSADTAPNNSNGAAVKTDWHNPTMEDIEALCRLITSDFIVGPIIVHKTALATETLIAWENQYNVTFTALSDGRLIIL